MASLDPQKRKADDSNPSPPPPPPPHQEITHPFRQTFFVEIQPAAVFEKPSSSNELLGAVRDGVVVVWFPLKDIKNPHFRSFFPKTTPQINDGVGGMWYNYSAGWACASARFFRIESRIRSKIAKDELQALRNEQESLCRLMNAYIMALRAAVIKSQAIQDEGMPHSTHYDILQQYEWRLTCLWKTGTEQKLAFNSDITAKGIFHHIDENRSHFLNLDQESTEKEQAASEHKAWEGEWTSCTEHGISDKWNRQNYSFARAKSGFNLIGDLPEAEPGYVTLFRDSMKKFG